MRFPGWIDVKPGKGHPQILSFPLACLPEERKSLLRLLLALLARHLLFGLLDEALHHVAAHIAVFAAGQVAVVALLEVDAQLPGDFKLHVVQGGAGLGHVGLIAVLAAGLIHCSVHLLFQGHCYFDPSAEKYAAILFKPTETEKNRFFCGKRVAFFVKMLYNEKGFQKNVRVFRRRLT